MQQTSGDEQARRGVGSEEMCGGASGCRALQAWGRAHLAISDERPESSSRPGTLATLAARALEPWPPCGIIENFPGNMFFWRDFPIRTYTSLTIIRSAGPYPCSHVDLVGAAVLGYRWPGAALPDLEKPSEKSRDASARRLSFFLSFFAHRPPVCLLS